MAEYLDLLKLNGEIKDWDYEGKLGRCGEHIFHFDTRPKTYIPDFCIRNNDDSFEYWECKGAVTKYTIDKFEQLHEYRPEVKITLIFRKEPAKKGRYALSVKKREKLERYCHRVIWSAKKELSKHIF